jgi:uncharacterized protein (TIGR02266 family)
MALRELAIDSGGGEQDLMPRPARAAVSLEVAFDSAGDVVRAYTQDVGMGGISIRTPNTLPRHTEVSLQLRVPGWAFPLRAAGKVVWSRADAMGIAFAEVRPEDYDRLRMLVLEQTTALDRARSRYGGRQEQPVPAEVKACNTALVQLADPLFTDIISDLLSLSGFVAVSDWISGSRPDVIVAERATAPAVPVAFQAAPVVVVNASGPGELRGSRAERLNAVAFVPRPASAVRIIEAVKHVLQAAERKPPPA